MAETLVTAASVAAQLQVTDTTVYNFGKRGVLTEVRFGRNVRYRQSEIDAIIQGRGAPQPTTPQPAR